MFLDEPKIRKIIYYVTIVLAAVAIVLGKIPTPWASLAADAIEELVVYLGGIAGVIAAGNVHKGPKIIDSTFVETNRSLTTNT